MSAHPKQHPQFTFGDRLRRLRLDAGLGTEEMGELLLTGRNSVGRWEGDRNPPPPRKLRRLVEIVAERTPYQPDTVRTFLGMAPVTDIAERRRSERRVASRLPSQPDMWIDDNDTVGNGSLRMLRAS